MADSGYVRRIESLWGAYAPKAREILAELREECRSAGLTTDDEPEEHRTDECEWVLRVWPTPERKEDDTVYIAVKVVEQAMTEDDQDAWGINLVIDLIGQGGLVLGGFAPYSYTDQVWVDSRDDDAVAARWSLLVEGDRSMLPALISNAWISNAWKGEYR